MPSKDIRFSEKKIDEGWKDQVGKNRVTIDRQPAASSQEVQPPEKHSKSTTTQKSSKAFLNLISSLGYQTMMHLGEIPHPETQTSEINLDAAREIIDLLAELKVKTEDNLSQEESNLLTGLLSELQLKFAQKT